MSKPQLFCFTYAGGNKGFFNDIKHDLNRVDLYAFDYAGHGERRKEPFYCSFDELADDLFDHLKTRIESGYALFGYSMGCIALVEVLKRILLEGITPPTHIFLAAHEPHSRSELIGFTEEELDEWVKERTVRFGGVPDKLRNNMTYWRTYLPLYRADYSIIGKYKFEELGLSTDISTTVFYSESDTPYDEMALWKRYFTGICDFFQYDGTHFFIQQHHKEMAEIIMRKMVRTECL